MTFTYDLNTTGVLILKAAIEDQNAIREMLAGHGCSCCSQCERDALESLIANSELDWVEPWEIGALTDAPILGLRASVSGKPFAAWGFMDYQIRSFLSDLLDKGQAIFIS